MYTALSYAFKNMYRSFCNLQIQCVHRNQVFLSRGQNLGCILHVTQVTSQPSVIVGNTSRDKFHFKN